MYSFNPFAVACLAAVAVSLVLAGASHAADPFARDGGVVHGIAAQHPGDAGIENHPSVVFTDMFEVESMEQVGQKWSWIRGADDVIHLTQEVDGPPGSTGTTRLVLAAEKGKTTPTMRKILDQGYEELYYRFYVKFAEDYGFNHHFFSIRGDASPTPMMMGGAGRRPTHSFGATLEPGVPREGTWFYYVYWPEMRSWQTPAGEPDGRPSPYYGNNFRPATPVPTTRGEWICVELRVKLNSAPDVADGELTFWIDGRLGGHWAPGSKRGYWNREHFRLDPDHEQAADFEGFRWRTAEGEDFNRVLANIIQVHNYVSSPHWDRAAALLEREPDFTINTERNTVYVDHIVVATEYIGPIVPRQ